MSAETEHRHAAALQWGEQNEIDAILAAKAHFDRTIRNDPNLTRRQIEYAWEAWLEEWSGAILKVCGSEQAQRKARRLAARLEAR